MMRDATFWLVLTKAIGQAKAGGDMFDSGESASPFKSGLFSPVRSFQQYLLCSVSSLSVGWNLLNKGYQPNMFLLHQRNAS